MLRRGPVAVGRRDRDVELPVGLLGAAANASHVQRSAQLLGGRRLARTVGLDSQALREVKPPEIRPGARVDDDAESSSRQIGTGQVIRRIVGTASIAGAPDLCTIARRPPWSMKLWWHWPWWRHVQVVPSLVRVGDGLDLHGGLEAGCAGRRL